MKILLFLSSCLVPVQFTDVPQNVTVNMSTPLFLSCDASGFPEPKIRWKKSGTYVSHTKQLNLSGSTRDDAGEYVCIASNGVGQDKTVRAYVTVQCKSLFGNRLFRTKDFSHKFWAVRTILSGHFAQ